MCFNFLRWPQRSPAKSPARYPTDEWRDDTQLGSRDVIREGRLCVQRSLSTLGLRYVHLRVIMGSTIRECDRLTRYSGHDVDRMAAFIDIYHPAITGLFFASVSTFPNIERVWAAGCYSTQALSLSEPNLRDFK